MGTLPGDTHEIMVASPRAGIETRKMINAGPGKDTGGTTPKNRMGMGTSVAVLQVLFGLDLVRAPWVSKRLSFSRKGLHTKSCPQTKFI